MLIETSHQDIIHDIAFNFDGNRFATASSDQTMRVYNKVDGKWEKSAECKFHDGPIWKIRWADPKFGQLIATCSQDKGVGVWEEKKFLQESPSGQKQIIVQWKQRILILESKEAVADIQFGSKSNGLLLAIAYVDGKLQIHRAHEQNQFIKEGEDVHIMDYGLRAISWNRAPLEREMLVAAGNAEQQKYLSKIKIDHSHSMKTMAIWMLQYENQKLGMKKIHEFEEEKTINDVQWANQNGKSFHLIASASIEGVKIWQIKIVKETEVEKMKVFNINRETKPNYQAYRVSWNILATLLAVSCESKKIDENQNQVTSREVRIYQNQNGSWVAKGIIQEANFLRESLSMQQFIANGLIS
ncbi:unnamed protein product [Paramecium sonneborni]|uniref:Uncharacterized protein n=1 Tax=Paramecium sonneborni TaxID=65129 RepID=A0A8S1MBZ0_9CILI|nr:unnamed protein product [Paramecium sonneborni]CAD8077950.1 unnamed protein product [Paramecium sonneborni]